MTGRVLIRTDGGAGIGSGHVMRCLALAQGCRERGIEPSFATAVPVPGFETRLQEEDFRWAQIPYPPGSRRDAEETRELSAAARADWVVVDGYHFDALYQQVVKESDGRLLVIDDYGHAGAYVADLVLNQNLHARTEQYPNIARHTRLLLGTAYVLLRKEFARAPRQHRTRDQARRLLITIGGSDPGPTVGVIRALPRLGADTLEGLVVVGPSNSNVEIIEAAAQASGVWLRVETDVRNMPELMNWADVAVASAGTISWELAFMGVPFVSVVVAENQQGVSASLDREGVAINLGWWSEDTAWPLAHTLGQMMGDPERRRRMSARGREIVDSRGVARVVEHMLASPLPGRESEEGRAEEVVHLGDEQLSIREVQADDCLLLWEWANDPEVRAAAFRSDPIPWDAHLRWFEAKRSDPSCRIFIVLDKHDQPAGQIRFERNGQREAVISVSVSAPRRGQGLGTEAIRSACERYIRDSGGTELVAFIKPQNIPSVRAFEKAGFARDGIMTIQGQAALRLRLTEFIRG
jgi:UDP-2,4-diacetamido-2,4,6-trideoxy-beta-L-altropyranose hydrolase